MNDSSDEPSLSHRIRSWIPSKAHVSPLAPTGASSDTYPSPTLNPALTQQQQQQQQDGAAEIHSLPKTGEEKSLGGEKCSEHQIDRLPDNSSPTSIPSAPPLVGEKGEGEKPPSVSPNEKIPMRKRFLLDCKRIILSSWINWLLLFVPVGIIVGSVQRAQGEESAITPTVVFSINAVAIVPLASLLSFATENVAVKMGDTIGALLNVTFGNAVELIVLIIALVAGQIQIVQAAALGSILANLLLILGMCFLFGGLRFREQLYNSTVSQMSACLLSLSVVSLLLPTAFHASFSNAQIADRVVLKVSRGTSVVLLFVYILYLLFQLKSHAYMYESTPQHLIDEESHPGVLAEMLNNSSSSDSSSSSGSDSDSSSGSHTTAKRIKRALRRKRRKSSVSSGDTFSLPSSRFPQSPPPSNIPGGENLMANSTQRISSKPSRSSETILSGDEADADGNDRRRQTRRSTGIESRDFEVPPKETSKEIPHQVEKDKKKRKRSRKWHRKAKVVEVAEGQPSPDRSGPGNDPTEKESVKASIVPPQVNIISETDEVTELGPKRPFHLRDLSRNALPRVFPPVRASQPAGGPATNFLIPQRLALPTTIRRTNSMPEMGQSASSPILGPAYIQPLPHLMPSNQQICVVDPKDSDAQKPLSRTSAILLLVSVTATVAVCAEFLIDSIDSFVKETGVSQAFIGLIILPIVGNAAEHVTAVTVASKNKMDLAIGVALGSSIQIAIFVTPLIVLLGWILEKDMSLYFSLFETISLFASTFIVNYLMIDGRSNYLEGALLIAAYVIIALAAFFYPSCENLSAAGGYGGGANCR